MPDLVELLENLRTRQSLREQPFASSVPVLGPVIAWFRTRWNNVATRWYVQPLIEQQNTFNAELVITLENLVEVLSERIEVLEENAIGLDRDLVTLTRDLAEARYQIIRTRKELEALQLGTSTTNKDNAEAV